MEGALSKLNWCTAQGRRMLTQMPFLWGPKPPVVEEAVQQDGVQVGAITACGSTVQDTQSLLKADPSTAVGESIDLASEQKKDTPLKKMIHYLEKGKLLKDARRARQVAVKGPWMEVFCILWTSVVDTREWSCLIISEEMLWGRLTARHVGAISPATDC